MKKQFFAGLILMGALLPTPAAIYSAGNVNGSGTSLNRAILDGNPNGISTTLAVSGAGSVLTSLSVTLNISGGYNGDLYGYLSYNGTLVTLLNRVGTGGGDAFGYATAGFSNVTLDGTSANGNIHNVENPLANTSYTPDIGGGNSLASFNGVNPNGTWTLFFADLSGGDVSTLNGWSLNLTAVPEPVNVALLIAGSTLALVSLGRWSFNRWSARAVKL
jgi:subtilisin-like proprotein convertase family protein